jgi:hypothetical protein
LNLALFGDSLLAIRLPSAVAAGLTVFLTGALASHLGGNAFSRTLAAVSVTASPLFLVMFSFFSMNSFEILSWLALVAVAVLIVERKEPRLWVAFGAIAGLSLENKHTVAVLAGALLFGFLLTPARRLLFNRWLWMGGALALLLFLPNLLWQIEHGFPSLEFYRNATLLKNRPTPALEVIGNQILFMGPLTLPLWTAGLYFCFRRRPELRFLPIAYLLLLAMLVVSRSSRPDRIAGLYPALIACGSIVLAERLRPFWSRSAALGLILAGSSVLGMVSLPVLPPERASRLLATLGIDTQIERGEGKQAELPQWLADRRGWPEMVDQVAGLYRALPESDRMRAAILAPTYGHAGALELFGWSDLPPVLSPHNSYHLWGRENLRALEGGVVISIGYGPDDLGDLYRSIQQVGVNDCDFCMQWRDEMPLFIARELAVSGPELARAWEEGKKYE